MPTPIPARPARNHHRLMPPAKAMPMKINTKISDTPASPDSTMFRPTTRPRWNRMCSTDGMLEISFWWDDITDAKMIMNAILQISAGWMLTGTSGMVSQLLLPVLWSSPKGISSRSMITLNATRTPRCSDMKSTSMEETTAYISTPSMVATS